MNIINWKRYRSVLLAGALGVYGVLATVICGVYVNALLTPAPFFSRDPRPSICIAFVFVLTAAVLAFTTARRLWKNAP